MSFCIVSCGNSQTWLLSSFCLTKISIKAIIADIVKQFLLLSSFYVCSRHFRVVSWVLKAFENVFSGVRKFVQTLGWGHLFKGYCCGNSGPGQHYHDVVCAYIETTSYAPKFWQFYLCLNCCNNTYANIVTIFCGLHHAFQYCGNITRAEKFW